MALCLRQLARRQAAGRAGLLQRARLPPPPPAAAAMHFRGGRLPSALGVRRLCAASGQDKDEGPPKPPATGAGLELTGLPSIVDQNLRGFGQVVFCNSPASGALIFGALAIGSYDTNGWLAPLAAVGAASATAAASAAGVDADAVDNGLATYNGVLVGCAFAEFFGPAHQWDPKLAVLTAAGGAATALLSVALKSACGAVPQWTLAFNFTALSALAYARPLADSNAGEASSFAELGPDQILSVAVSPLTGISQIFVINSPVTGAVILAALALYSKKCAGYTLAGSAIGAVCGFAAGADPTAVANGLWGFNPALTALAISVFFVETPASVGLATGGAAATALLSAGLGSMFVSAFGMPACTLPFCLAASGCYLLQGNIPGLVLAESPHSPEQNRARD